MKWKKECENGEGFYWLRHNVRLNVNEVRQVTEIVCIAKLDDDWWVSFCGDDCDELLNNFDDCYWYGPLEPPEFKSWHEEHPLSPEPSRRLRNE